MLVKNCYALIPLKGKEIEITDADPSNILGKNCENIVFISGTGEPMYNEIGNNCTNILMTDKFADINKFWPRFKFCFNLLFNYKKERKGDNNRDRMFFMYRNVRK